MDLKRLYMPLIAIMILISLYSGFYISTATAFPQNPSTYAYFNKISDMPHVYHISAISTEEFWAHGGDCSDRAQVFKQYLESKGATNIQTVNVRCVVNGNSVMTKNNDYGHCFLLWNGKVYNPALNKTVRFYDKDLNEYKKILKSDYYGGVNTLYYENGTVELLL